MSNFKYTNDHECIYIDGDVAWVGISDYAQEALGDLVYVELPDIGKQVKKGEEFAVVESVKTAAEVYSPVDGEVVEINTSLPDNLELLNSDPYGAGWIIKVKLTDDQGLAKLLDHGAYESQCS